MLETLLTAGVLGFLAGGVPGPYTTVVASRALEKGFGAGLRLAFIPLITDVPPMLVTVFLLQRLNYDILTGVGVVGGLVLAWLGLRFYRRQEEAFNVDDAAEQRRTFGALAVAGLLSPAPWLFWFVAAGPLLVRALQRSLMQGVMFAGVLLAMLIGTATAIAWGASHGHRVLPEARRRRILKVVGVVLMIGGGILVWQALEGNFQEMVQRQEELRERVESRRRSPGA